MSNINKPSIFKVYENAKNDFLRLIAMEDETHLIVFIENLNNFREDIYSFIEEKSLVEFSLKRSPLVIDILFNKDKLSIEDTNNISKEVLFFMKSNRFNEKYMDSCFYMLNKCLYVNPMIMGDVIFYNISYEKNKDIDDALINYYIKNDNFDLKWTNKHTGENLIFDAVRNNSKKLVEELLLKNIPLNVISLRNENVFFYCRSISLFELLKEKEPNLDEHLINNKGENILFKVKYCILFRHLVENRGLNIYQRNIYNESIFTKMYSGDMVDIVSYLLSKGMDVNEIDRNGNNLLMNVLIKRQKMLSILNSRLNNTFNQLIVAGINLKQINNENYTAKDLVKSLKANLDKDILNVINTAGEQVEILKKLTVNDNDTNKTKKRI